MAMVPWRTGLLVSAAAWAIGAEPNPDSLENIPRATPIRSAKISVEPANPPVNGTLKDGDLVILGGAQKIIEGKIINL